MWEEEYEDWDWEEDEEEWTGCTIDHTVDEVCPECCTFGGDYQPGVERCEFCVWAEACEEIKYGKRR